MDRKLLGRRINQARKESGMTSEKLSELCSINATYLRQIEAGVKLPSLPLFVILCDKLNVAPSWLLADQVDTGSQDGQAIDALLRFCRSLTPRQVRMIAAFLQSAKENDTPQE